MKFQIMKICPQFEAVTVTAKQLIFLDSALDLEEKMPNNLWGAVSSSSKNPIFLKCDSFVYIFFFLLDTTILDRNGLNWTRLNLARSDWARIRYDWRVNHP